MSENLVFSTAFEGLFRATAPDLTSTVKSKLRALGVDADSKLLPGYSQQTFVDTIRLLAKTCFPSELDENRAIALLGRKFMDGYKQTILGKAIVAIFPMIGPKRTLERLTRNFRSGNNFSETRLEVASGENTFLLWVNEVQFPGWYIGLVERGLEMAGAQKPHMVFKKRDDAEGKGGTFEISWSNTKG